MTTAAGVQIEFEAVQEACADLVRAHRALANRRGPLYRELEQDIERDGATILRLEVLTHDLGDGYFVMSAPDQLSALLRRARALRLI